MNNLTPNATESAHATPATPAVFPYPYRATYTLANATETRAAISVFFLNQDATDIIVNVDGRGFDITDIRAIVPHFPLMRNCLVSQDIAANALTRLCPALFARVSHLFGVWEFTQDNHDWDRYLSALNSLPSLDLLTSLGSEYASLWSTIATNAPKYTHAAVCDSFGIVQSAHKSICAATRAATKQNVPDSFIALLTEKPALGSVIDTSFTNVGLTATEYRAASTVSHQATLHRARAYRVAMMPTDNGGIACESSRLEYRKTIAPFILNLA